MDKYIDSPFIINTPMKMLYPIFEKLINREVKIYIVTRNPNECLPNMQEQADNKIQCFE